MACTQAHAHAAAHASVYPMGQLALQCTPGQCTPGRLRALLQLPAMSQPSCSPCDISSLGRGGQVRERCTSSRSLQMGAHRQPASVRARWGRHITTCVLRPPLLRVKVSPTWQVRSVLSTWQNAPCRRRGQAEMQAGQECDPVARQQATAECLLLCRITLACSGCTQHARSCFTALVGTQDVADAMHAKIMPCCYVISLPRSHLLGWHSLTAVQQSCWVAYTASAAGMGMLCTAFLHSRCSCTKGT
jgi:hypothetical protein